MIETDEKTLKMLENRRYICPVCNLEIQADHPPPRGDFVVCERCSGIFEVIEGGLNSLAWPDDSLFLTSRTNRLKNF